MNKADIDKLNTVQKHIDKRVVESLTNGDFDDARQMLLEKIQKFKNHLKSENYTFDENTLTIEGILQIPNFKRKYWLAYIFFSKKRIIDLYWVESKKSVLSKTFYPYGKSFTNVKAFNIYVMKERLKKGLTINPPPIPKIDKITFDERIRLLKYRDKEDIEEHFMKYGCSCLRVYNETIHCDYHLYKKYNPDLFICDTQEHKIYLSNNA